jgi:hypothetical protein
MNDKKVPSPLFPLGTICCTPGAVLKLMRFGADGLQLLARHVTGDFGDLGDEDKASNTAAIAEGGRVFSSYEIAPRVKVWVITEADRSSTTLLLPSEY